MCAQSYMDQSKKIFDHFICFWKWFLSLFVFIFSAYFVFHCLNMFCFEKQLSEFLATHFGYLHELPILATRFGDLQVASPSREFTQKSFVTQLATRQSWNAKNQLFKELFRGKLVLNLSHSLLNPSFNSFTSKPNQFEWVFIPLTSLR